jgi:hypothetical protein
MAKVIEFHTPKNLRRPFRQAPSSEKMYKPSPREVSFKETILKLFRHLTTISRVPACPAARDAAPVTTTEKTSTCNIGQS